ncbi:hypothetical protein [Psychrobacillus sp. OK032]|uniref:hypothetical protein n=1 Tax=Psychrobacillus sp. OK032 TaxID=1884358 RepID=UPI0008D28439|nr:hypothetical protein [Psychrobacillus sp. OK032]SER68985.1 hypothetical protein SAMN05518872_101640 [Psychrobacillus sp. OK032]
MNKTRSALLIGGIAALAYAYYTKLDREQAMTTLKNTKTKINSYADAKKHKPTQMTKAGFSDPDDPDDNRMVEEGSMTSVQYYNEKVQEPDSKSAAKNAFPKSQQKKLPKSEESLSDANNHSPAKQENTNHSV